MTDQTVIRQWGNSQGVRIGKEHLEAAKLKLSDTLKIEASENVIILRKVKKHKTFEERLAEYDGNISICDFDWGSPQGKELL